MASEIRVNKINSRTGVGTITLSPTGVDFTGITTVATLSVTGTTTLNGNLDLQDNDKILIGTGDDLQIYHDGSNSYVVEEGTGELRLNSDNAVRIRKHDNETMALFTANGASELYYDNSKKFETTTNGVTVTGRVACDEVRTGDNDKIQLGDSQDFRVYHDGSTNIIDGHYHPIELRHQSEVHAKFVDDGAVELYHNNVKKFETKSDGVVVTGGIYLDGSGGTNSANKLGDYEEGTYTVTVTCGTSGTITLNSGYNTMAYEKIGRQVTVHGRVRISSVSSPSGTVLLNLPFTRDGMAQDQNRICGTLLVQNLSANINEYGIHPTGSTGVEICRTDATAPNLTPASNFSGDEFIYMSVTYRTAS